MKSFLDVMTFIIMTAKQNGNKDVTVIKSFSLTNECFCQMDVSSIIIDDVCSSDDISFSNVLSCLYNQPLNLFCHQFIKRLISVNFHSSLNEHGHY